jgi:hypothetical protein
MNQNIHEKIAMMTDITHPKCELWSNQSKTVIVAKFEYRAEKVHYYFDKYHAHLSMVWKSMFPLDPAPETLSAMFNRFKTPIRIRSLVHKELLPGAELAIASVLACHEAIYLESIANTNSRLDQYNPIARHHAYIIVSRMEASSEGDLKNQEDQRTLL